MVYFLQMDLFSFCIIGIMCWEIYNNGIEPYPGMTVAEVNQNVRHSLYYGVNFHSSELTFR